MDFAYCSEQRLILKKSRKDVRLNPAFDWWYLLTHKVLHSNEKTLSFPPISQSLEKSSSRFQSVLLCSYLERSPAVFSSCVSCSSAVSIACQDGLTCWRADFNWSDWSSQVEWGGKICRSLPAGFYWQACWDQAKRCGAVSWRSPPSFLPRVRTSSWEVGSILSTSVSC